MLQCDNNNNCKTSLKHDLLIATIPALLAITLQKALDEVSDLLHRREERLSPSREPNKEEKDKETSSKRDSLRPDSIIPDSLKK